MADFITKICGSQFWNPNFIHDKNPNFTACFQNTVLIWINCLILWILSPFWIYMLTRKRPFKLNVNWLLISKTISISLLIVIELTKLMLLLNKYLSKPEASRHIPLVYYLTPIILILTYAFIIIIIHYERIKGLRSSTLLFAFWLISTLTMIILLRTHILNYKQKMNLYEKFNFTSFIISFTLIIVNLILSIINHKTNISIKTRTGLKIYPENYVSLLSKLIFWWVNPIIKNGYNRDLTKEDLWEPEKDEASEFLTNKFENIWNQVAKKYIDNKYHYDNNKSDVFAKYKTKSNYKEELYLNPHNVEIKSKKVKEPSLVLCIIKAFGGKFLAGSFLKLVHDTLMFGGPLLLGLLVDFIKDKDQSLFMGFFYTALIFISQVAQTLFLQHYFHRMFVVGARLRTSIMNIIYRKSLKLSNSARKESTIGQMVNLLSIDSQTLYNLTTYLNIIWSGPFQITVCLYMLWHYIGVAAFAGLATMAIFVPLNVVISHVIKKFRKKKMEQTDTRIKSTNDMLNGIKVIKFYGWELSFRNLITKIRNNELSILKKAAFTNAASALMWNFAPLLVSLVSFATFLFVDKNNKLDARTAFVCLTLFNILKFPLSVLPMVISNLVEASVSVKRIREFLLKEDLNKNDITYNDLKGLSLKVTDSNFSWDSNEKALLKNINFEIKKGELVAIVGSVGCGKSSLVSALLGDMHKFDGEVNINGSKAFVSQQAWIQNATLKANVLFGSTLNEEYYQKVLEACALKNDLKILPAGDQTEIGEKGINLSGGQKARVSLARAVYSNMDIYFLDDPLSAVDAHVSKHIFNSVISSKTGILKNKTRIFVTNTLNVLPEVDKIIMLDNGNIVEIGDYDDLKNSNGKFSSFIKSYIENQEKTNEKANFDSKDGINFNDLEIDNLNFNNADNINSIENDTDNENSKLLNKEELSKPIDKKIDKNDTINKKGEKIITKEKAETGAVKFSTLLEYLKALKWYWMVLFLSFHLLSQGTQVGSSFWLSDWSNKVDQENNNSELRNRRLIVYVILGILQGFLYLLADWIFVEMLIKSASGLHNSMLISILRSKMSFFEQTPVGRIINRFNKDIEAVESNIPDSYKSLIRCVIQVISTVIVISTSTPIFIIPLIPIIILYIFCQRYYVSSTRHLKRLESISKSPIFSHFNETLSGVSTIRAFGVQNRFIKQMEERIDENLIYFYPNNVAGRWLAVRIEFIGTLICFFASLFAVFSRNSISAGIAGLSISYSLNLSQTLNWLIRQFSDFEANITSIERINEYQNTPHEDSWDTDKIELNKLWPNNGEIKFFNYSVKYRDDLDYVLKNINFEIKPSEKIGIVGRTGAGKSSLASALFRIIESNEGEIDIDGINIKNVGLHNLRHRITIIPQDPVLFCGTLKFNIDPLDQYNEIEIWNALEQVNLKSYVQSLNKELLFEVSEGGENLSVGQRQLICLARALLRKTKILLLDEATASIDHNTDELIQETIKKSFSKCTILTIAHRLHTIIDYDRIMVLDKGKVVEFDIPKTLLSNKNSLFYSLAIDAGITI